jgi:hypothetical protein
MALRPGTWWLPCLLLSLLSIVLSSLPAQAAAGAAAAAIVDPAQRAQMNDLFRAFIAAKGPQGAFTRYLLPRPADAALSWYPRQFLVPLANSTTQSAPLPGYPVGADGQLLATPVTLGLAQASQIVSGALTPSGNTCYLAQGGDSDSIAAYTVDLASSQLSPFPGSLVQAIPHEWQQGRVAVGPSGRFLHAVDGTGVSTYAIDLASTALTWIGAAPTPLDQPAAIVATRQCVFVTSNQAGYDAFAIDRTTGALGRVPGSPFGLDQSYSAAATPDGNFVYFSVPPYPNFDGGFDPPFIAGFFVDPASCALTPVPGSPFGVPGGFLGIHPRLPVLYAAAYESVQALAIDPGTGTLSPLGTALHIDAFPNAVAVGPKGDVLWLWDYIKSNLLSVTLDPATGIPAAAGAPVPGPQDVRALLAVGGDGGQLVGLGIAQARVQHVLGGAPPYRFALSGGSLPAGMTLDPASGQIIGTPTTPGQSTFEILVTDAVGATSSSVQALKVLAPPTGPAAPTNLAAVATSPTTAALSWQDNAAQSAAFHVDLSQDGGPFVEVQAVKPQATTAVVAGLSPATAYTFRVHAANAGGSSSTATAVTVTTPALAAVPCASGANGQCLLAGRFFVEALYQDAVGEAGLAHVVPITSDTAYLWFFSAANAEVVIKLLDGCKLGNHYWVFAGGLTNLHVILRVTDTRTGAVRTYEVPYGPAFAPLQDTAAFGTCSAAAP